MSNIINTISAQIIEDIILYNSINITKIEGKLTDSFYDFIDNDDVKFLKKIKGISQFNNSQKIKIFHESLRVISTILFKHYLEIKNVKISNESLATFFGDYEQISSKELVRNIYKQISNLGEEEIKKSLQDLYVDITCLVSRKSSGTEFTPQSIVSFMFDTIDYRDKGIEQCKLLEPACGSGIFLLEAMRRVCKVIDNNNMQEIKKIMLEDKIIVGYDINPINVFISKLLIILEIVGIYSDITEEDILEFYEHLPIKVENALKVTEENYYDYVIGNPPYIRLQNLPIEERKYIKKNFLSATGRFDLYVCFMEKAIRMLKDGGGISLITSNKYFTANYGEGIRNLISKNVQIDILFDLHDTKFFEASVLPAIISGWKKRVPNNEKFSYFHIKQDNSDRNEYAAQDIFSLILDLKGKEDEDKNYYKVNNGRIDLSVEFVYSKEKLPLKKQQWNFGSKDDIAIKRYIENQDVECLSSIAEVCVGIKTTADNVFVWPMTQQFVQAQEFENEVIYPLIQSHDVNRWSINWSSNCPDDRFIIYPHEVKNSKMVAVDLDNYPNVKRYLNENEVQLKSREYLMKSKTRKWYECWVPQHLFKFKQVKIVTSDIVSTNSFALDCSGRLCQGNTFFIILKPSLLYQYSLGELDFMKFLLGVLNSEVMEFYQKSISGSLYSKKYRYTSANLNRWLIPKIKGENIQNVKRIITLVDDLNVKETKHTKELEEELNRTVYSLYNIPSNYVADIKSFLETNS